jgi:hypothetical protein
MLKIVDDVPKVLYNQNNSGLETITYLGPNYFDVRITALPLIKQEIWVTNSVKTESKCCAPMGNGKNIQLIKYCRKTIVFLEWSLTEMESSGWVQIVME